MNDSTQAETNGTTINAIATILVVIVAGFAFVLSYSSLQHMAANNGFEGTKWLSYLWPLLLDFAMIVFSLAILRANLRGEDNTYPWVLTIVFATLATVANVLDATTLGIPPAAIRATVKALAPITLVLAFELLMTMLRAEEARKGKLISIGNLAANIGRLTEEIEQLAGNRDRLQRQISTLEDAKSGAKTRPMPANTQDKKAQNIMALLAYYAKDPQSTYTQAANEIGVSRQTIANYLDELEEAGAIHRNGQGVQVLSLDGREPATEPVETTPR